MFEIVDQKMMGPPRMAPSINTVRPRQVTVLGKEYLFSTSLLNGWA
jgi:hypothetical protein